jgi:predicted secreted hydrolase
MSAAELEAPRPFRKPGDTDAVTYSWADPESGLYGLARVAAGVIADGAAQSSALAVAFAGREPLGAIAEAGETPPAELVAETESPLERWTLRAEGELRFELTFEALTPPAEYGGRQAVVKAGGMEGYEQVCRVTGTMLVDGRERPVNGFGQRGHSWGNPDWDKIALTRSVGAWFEDGTGAVLATVRPAKAEHHADEGIWAAVLDAERALSVEDPRLSTTTDEAGRQIRAGVELWVDKDDDYPLRGTGEVLAGSTLELGALRLDVAFFAWHIEGRTAIGRYDVLRRS